MLYYVICDFRESFLSSIDSSKTSYNDHPERKNIEELLQAMQILGLDCEYFGGIPELIHAVDNKTELKNCCFINFTDGMIQPYSRTQAPLLLDILDVPYTGSDVFVVSLASNKHYCKLALSDCDFINIPKSILVSDNSPFSEEEISKIGYPIIIKPNTEGSSLGISQKNICHSFDDAINIIHSLKNNYHELIAEEYLHGIDVTNYMIGNFPNYKINDVIVSKLQNTSKYAVYGANEKRNRLRTLYFNTEYLSDEIVERIRESSIIIAKKLGLKDICRIDYRYNADTNKLYFIEVNTSPRFSTETEIGFIAQKRNLYFHDMVKLYLDSFCERFNREHVR